MSLKAFHLIFVTLATLVCLGVSGWGFEHYRGPHGEGSHMAYGIGGLFCAVILVVYGRYFLKKLRHIPFL